MVCVGCVGTDCAVCGAELCGAGVDVVCCEISGFDSAGFSVEFTGGSTDDMGSELLITGSLENSAVVVDTAIELLLDEVEVFDISETTDDSGTLDVLFDEFPPAAAPIEPKTTTPPTIPIIAFVLFVIIQFPFNSLA